MRSADRQTRDGPGRTTGAGTVLRAVLDHGPLARSAVSQLTGRSPASVTGHTAALLSAGLLVAMPERRPSAGLGRPSVPLDLDPDAGIVGAVHFAVPFSTVALLDLRGKVLHERRLARAAGPADDAVTGAVRALAELISAEAPESRLLGVGVAAGGWVDPIRGVIVEHDVLGWRDLPVGRIVARELGVPVRVDSHARSLVRAEQLFGASGRSTSILGVFVGNIVDAALAIGDDVHQGARSRAGAIAHRPVAGSVERCGCGRVGCLQATVSEARLVQRAYGNGLIDAPNIFELLRVARAGNDRARALFRERAEIVGRALGPMIDMFAPEQVVVVEPGVCYLPECRDALRAQIDRSSSTASGTARSIVPSSFPDTLLAMAGGAVFLDALYRDPLGLLAAQGLDTTSL